MPFVVQYADKAKTDVRSISIGYRDKKFGLDDEFLLSLEAAIKAILRDPLQYRIIHLVIRSASLKRFPYKIYFIVRNDTIIVLGLFHSSRSLQTIKSRFEDQ